MSERFIMVCFYKLACTNSMVRGNRCGLSPEAVLPRVVFKAHLGEASLQFLPAELEVVTQGIERGILVAQLGVDKAQKHQGV